MDDTWEQRKKQLSENKIVKRPLAQLDSGVLPTSKKRRKKMTPKQMLANINAYFKFCEREDEIPSITGMMIHMKLYKEQFYSYLKQPAYSDLMEQARLVIQNWLETDVYNTKGLATGKVAYMKNCHGWTEKTESTQTTVQIDMTPELARAKIEALAPKLLEVLQNSHLLNQLVEKPKEIDITPEAK